MGPFVVGIDDPKAEDVQALLSAHLAFADQHSPPEHIHVLDLTRLLAPDVSFFSVRDNGQLLGVGALKQLDERHAEIKSMHTAEHARGRGVARAMVHHLVAVARTRGCNRVSLETGSMAAFDPALTLYESVGFEVCEPFAGYRPSRYSICMTLELESLD
jgi:putative acetyltransferase